MSYYEYIYCEPIINVSYQHYTCLLNEKFLKTNNECPTLGVQPHNILFVEGDNSHYATISL